MFNESLPTEKEINPTGCTMDGKYAVKNWLNVSIEKGTENLANNALHYGEDFMYMGKVAFSYYLQSALQYAKSEESNQDSDFVSSFVGIIDFRLSNDKNDVIYSRARCMEFLTYIIENIKKFKVNQAIYGTIQGEAQKLKNAISHI